MAIIPENITTVRVGELAPAPFSLTDKIPHEVGTDLKSATIQDLITFITPLIGAMQYQVLTFHVNQAFIDANFNMTPGVTMGLGINLMTGFAIVNGNNGTLNKDGRTGIAYGTTTNVIGQFGGSKDAVVVAHSHTFDPGYEGFTAGGNNSAASRLEPPSHANTVPYRTTETAGVSGVGKNMQPYIVELQVMKL